MIGRAVLLVVLAAVAVTATAMGQEPAGAAVQRPCAKAQIPTAQGCQGEGAVRSHIAELVGEARAESGIKAAVVRVDLGPRTLFRGALGNSQAGIPARPAMSFRIGSMTIPALTTVLLQLRDEGRLKLSDPVSRWLPNLPGARRTTVLMLMNNTSGLRDWIQGNAVFNALQERNPFRLWREGELLRTALARGRACDPGACFHYAHTNYLLLGRLLRELTGSSIVGELGRRVLRPLGMRRLRFSSLAPIPAPALHSYTTERGVFEDATAWSPSWTLGSGMIATATVDDVIRIASGIFSARTLSRSSRQMLTRQFGPDLAPGTYYAQGLIVRDGWRIQNPYLNGYMGNISWLPERRLAIAAAATRAAEVPADDATNLTDALVTEIGAYLAPGRPLG